MRKREIIRIALKSLDEFKNLNIDYKKLNSQYEENTTLGMSDEEEENYDLLFSLTADTLVQKYGSMLYLKSIEEIDEIFKSENIII